MIFITDFTPVYIEDVAEAITLEGERLNLKKQGKQAPPFTAKKVTKSVWVQ